MKKSCCPAESAVRPDNKFKIISGEPVTDIVCLGIRKTFFIPGEPVTDIVCFGIRKTIFIPGEPVTDIVCYGIGKLSSCPTARYQFAFFLLLRELLKVAMSGDPCEMDFGICRNS